MNRIRFLTYSKDDRTTNIKYNVFFSFINKGFSIIISLLLVTLTIKYVNKEQYGIWLAISSIVGWMSFFDFGLTHGLRNKFAEAKANGNNELARQYVSTSYFAFIIIFSSICAIGCITNSHINWSKLLNLSSRLNPTLITVFYISICGLCSQLILNVLTTIITADQKPALAASINTLGQFFVLISIALLMLSTEGSLIKLSFAISVVPSIVYLAATIYFFKTSYIDFTPKWKFVNSVLIKDILGLGSKFFIIQLSMVFVFQIVNIIVLRTLGAESVTIYNIAYKYFSIVYMITIIIINPFWSAFTDAFYKNDYSWMNKTYFKLSKVWLISIPVVIIMILISNFVYRIWIGGELHIPIQISIGMGIYILFLSRSNLSMYLINGTGKVTIQMIIYIIFAIITIPAMTFLCKQFGLLGVLSVVTLQCLTQSIYGEIQVRKIIKNTASGLWNI